VLRNINNTVLTGLWVYTNNVNKQQPKPMGKIIVEIRSNYGNEAIYVVSENAEAVRTLTKKKTIDRSDIAALRSLGLSVEVQQLEALTV
tara:strand:- start:278 stop:544 length:267 start_codon:yes stop_codon:yes gene_type:complete